MPSRPHGPAGLRSTVLVALALASLVSLACRATGSERAAPPDAAGAASPWTAPARAESWWTRAQPCPGGAVLRGAAPPAGVRVWCETEAGDAEGPATTFYDDGVRRSDAMYRNGRMHGPWRQFFPDGRPRSEGEYADGRDVGMWRSYHDNGKLATEADHRTDGTVAFVEYRESGAKAREGGFTDGLEQGEWTIWGADGTPQTVVYDHGKPVTGGDVAAIGIPACDEYIGKYRRCITSKMPEAARAQMMEAMDMSVAAWREAAKGPARDGLATACKAALDAARQATAHMGCEW
ncbi:MAG TPA: hypothetical protein VFG69_07395 [Nannocystaceae bacterium]|nr:hypothetical protein [Nannocystaceae bacterium]